MQEEWFQHPRRWARTDPDRMATAIDAQARSPLGDIGHVDADGYLYLTDRRNAMIRSGGVNVYPQEAKNRAMAHAEVADAWVFGVPHGDMKEVLHAAIMPLDPEADRAGLETRRDQRCRAAPASIKCPRPWEIRAELPRQDTGKIDARHLREEWLARHGAS